MTFTEILNNAEYKQMVEGIEDTLSSLRSYPNGDKTLQQILENQISQLFKATGHQWVL